MSLAATRAGGSPRDGASGSCGHSRPASTEPSDGLFALDPSLHNATLNSVSGDERILGDSQNPLAHFAQQVVDHDGASSLLFNEDNSLFTAEGEARVLVGSGNQSERVEQVSDQHHNQPFAFDHASALGNTGEHTIHHPGHQESDDVKMGRLVGRKRRRDGDDLGVVGPVENGDPIDPVKMKKDSHKEVERRRRENINDGINEIARLIPNGMDKMGKGLLLKKAAEYLTDVTSRLARVDEDLAAKDREKAAVQAELTHMQTRLAEEHARSMRFETSWHEVEDRVASAQFEIGSLKAEVKELKKRLNE